jgi:pimeloyl-ACP methyl ester carboxylesterase
MSTQQTAKTEYIEANGIKFAYRRFGLTTGVPLVFVQHFRGTMDHWDPDLINPPAKTRPIVLLDNSSVGFSGGEVPETFAGWAAKVVALVEALGTKQVDLLGFFMGGMTAQMVALNASHLVRSLILGGTGTRHKEPSSCSPIQNTKLKRKEKKERKKVWRSYLSLALHASLASYSEFRSICLRPSTKVPKVAKVPKP